MIIMTLTSISSLSEALNIRFDKVGVQYTVPMEEYPELRTSSLSTVNKDVDYTQQAFNLVFIKHGNWKLQTNALMLSRSFLTLSFLCVLYRSLFMPCILTLLSKQPTPEQKNSTKSTKFQKVQNEQII